MQEELDQLKKQLERVGESGGVPTDQLAEMSMGMFYSKFSPIIPFLRYYKTARKPGERSRACGKRQAKSDELAEEKRSRNQKDRK